MAGRNVQLMPGEFSRVFSTVFETKICFTFEEKVEAGIQKGWIESWTRLRPGRCSYHSCSAVGKATARRYKLPSRIPTIHPKKANTVLHHVGLELNPYNISIYLVL